MFVNIGSLILELIKVESGFIDEVCNLASHNLVVIKRTPENKGVLRVIHKLEAALVSQILHDLHVI